MWGDTSLHVKYVFLNLFFSDYSAMYGPVYWERNKIQVQRFNVLGIVDTNLNEKSHENCSKL